MPVKGSFLHEGQYWQKWGTQSHHSGEKSEWYPSPPTPTKSTRAQTPPPVVKKPEPHAAGSSGSETGPKNLQADLQAAAPTGQDTKIMGNLNVKDLKVLVGALGGAAKASLGGAVRAKPRVLRGRPKRCGSFCCSAAWWWRRLSRTFGAAAVAAEAAVGGAAAVATDRA